jgi:CheY-like chemotaxis protein
MVAQTALRPLSRLRGEGSLEDAPPAISKRPARRAQDQPSILLVHADPWVRTLVSQVLLDAGYAVLEASNGASGLRAVARSCPNVILVGGELPEVRCADFLDAVQAEYTGQRTCISGLDQPLLAYF